MIKIHLKGYIHKQDQPKASQTKKKLLVEEQDIKNAALDGTNNTKCYLDVSNEINCFKLSDYHLIERNRLSFNLLRFEMVGPYQI